MYQEKYGRLRFQHAGIHVKSIEETIRWYHDILGFEEVPTPDSAVFKGCFPNSQLIKNGDFYLELYEVPDAAGFDWVNLEYNLGVKHLCFSVEHLDLLMKDLRERGDVVILVDNEYSEEVCHVPGGDNAVYILDNNGILLELSKVHSRG